MWTDMYNHIAAAKQAVSERTSPSAIAKQKAVCVCVCMYSSFSCGGGGSAGLTWRAALTAELDPFTLSPLCSQFNGSLPRWRATVDVVLCCRIFGAFDMFAALTERTLCVEAVIMWSFGSGYLKSCCWCSQNAATAFCVGVASLHDYGSPLRSVKYNDYENQL